jgi:glycosyltransferase involved in cell wall biosynthesis
MRIALDIRYKTNSGASTYIRNLVPRLLKSKSTYEFLLVKFSEQAIDGSDLVESVICPDQGAVRQICWDQAILPRKLHRNHIDLYHTFKMLGPRFTCCPRIKVGHSIYSSFRGEFPLTKKQTAYWSIFGKHLHRSFTRILAVSEYVRDYFVEGLKMAESKVTVIHSGIDSRFRLLSNEENTAEKILGFSGPFLLTVGNIFPVKNHLTAVRAFASVGQKLPEIHLVMAGRTDNPYFEKVKEAADQSGLAEKIHFIGFVDPDQLVFLYNKAKALLMPSLTEGFPISLLEAMTCGLPVIGAKRGGIIELGDDAVRIVDDPFDISAWSEAIYGLLEEPELRKKMRKASLERASEFSWDRTAEETFKVYESILSSGR